MTLFQRFAFWVNDKRWAANVRRARRFRRQLSYSRRRRFDEALRHPIEKAGQTVIGYPDAFYHVTIDDLLRAMDAASR